MRITSKIMQNNSLSNINKNKLLQDKLNIQMTTENKLTKASDDPVVAIRALRLRTSLSEVTQYYERNVPDARSWLEITDGALKETAEVLTKLYGECTRGASDGGMTTESRQAILKSMKQLRNQIYSAADTDMTGRNVFTGFRTNTKALFKSDTKQDYRITEQLTRDNISKVTYVDPSDLKELNSQNYKTLGATEQDIESYEVYRMRLGYGNLKMPANPTDPAIPKLTDGAGNPIQVGTPLADIVVTSVSVSGTPNPYVTAANNPNAAIFIPETGELIMGKDVHAKLAGMMDDPATKGMNEGEIRISYTKEDWKEGDLNPINYYACSTEKDGKTVEYNMEYLDPTVGKTPQEISYDVGFSQKLRVNTTLDEVFDPGIGRDVDELVSTLEEVDGMEEIVKTLKGLVEKDPEDAEAKEKLAAAEKALTFMNDKLKKQFASGITTMKKYEDRANVAIADSGTRGARLDMIENRLATQQLTFDTLAAENEKIDLTKVAIELGSASLAYEAALLATGKIAQTSLLNYI